MTPDQDDYLAEDGSRSRSLLAAGWLRALLVLGALAVVIVVTVPYILQWLETAPPERPAMTTASVSRPAPTSLPPVETAPAPAAAPAASAPAIATAPAPAVSEAPAAKEASPAKDVSATKDLPAAKDAPAAKAGTAPAAKDKLASTLSAKAPGATTARAAAAAPAAPAISLDGSGGYWVQVGLFENASNAERLAQELRADRFSVQVAQVTRGGAAPATSRHEVFVTGSSVDAVTAALRGSATAQAVTGGVVVRPALDLKDAVTLSRRLASEGLDVRIRRAVSAPAGGGGTTIHLVRVGDYGTPAEAQAGKKQLAAKGISGFITQGAAK